MLRVITRRVKTLMIKHNKKRNVGIIYELLLRHVSSCIVENKQQEADVAMSIVKRHFKKSSELYKEFRLFNALVKTTASSPSIANTILSEAREYAQTIDQKKLSSEKTSLIHSVNHNLIRETFYKRHLPEYRMYATIQILLNDWRSLNESRNFTRIAEFEEKVRTWLIKEKVQQPNIENMTNPDADKLVIRIMSEKIDKKYQSSLNEDQKKILRAYVLSSENENKSELREMLESVRTDTLTTLGDYLIRENNAVLNAKADRVINDVKSVSTDQIDDSTITRFLTISHLNRTITEEGL